MSVKVDQGFINGLLALFASDPLTEEQEAALFREDCKVIDTALLEEASQTSSSQQKNYYDILHFSPLKVCQMHINHTWRLNLCISFWYLQTNKAFMGIEGNI